MSYSINVESLVSIIVSEDKEMLESFLKMTDDNYYNKGNNKLKNELNEIHSFFTELLPNIQGSDKSSGYYLGVTIQDGIREEFDILRYSNQKIINVEVKRENPADGLEGITNQLKRHQYLLKNINTNVECYSYVADQNVLYKLQDGCLIEAAFETLSSEIPAEYIDKNLLEDLDTIDLLVSPYSKCTEFNDCEYFLTDEQMRVRREVINSDSGLITISGAAGSGKSLLIFDLAKKYKEEGCSVLVIFCASLSEDTIVLRDKNIPVKEVKRINFDDVSFFDEYDVIFVDEAQRLYENQFKKLTELTTKRIILSVDHMQTLHDTEVLLNVEKKLKEISDFYVIKSRVRSCVATATFIMKMLNLKECSLQPIEFNNVKIVPFSTEEQAKTYIDNQVSRGFTSIELTQYTTKELGNQYRQPISDKSLNTHNVIGREYENVLVVLDRYFFYNDEAKLDSNYPKYYPYIESSCIFEALTRVKRKLEIVVVDNPNIYLTLQQIITWKSDKLIEKEMNRM